MFNAYLKIANIPGQSTDSKHKDWIELQGFQFHGMQQQAGKSLSSGQALSGGRSEMQAITFTKYIDKASPKIYEAVLSGTHIDNATLSVTRQTGSKSGPVEFFKYEVKQAMINDFNCQGIMEDEGGKEATPIPLETFSLVATDHSWTYTETDVKGDKKGSVASNHSFKSNT